MRPIRLLLFYFFQSSSLLLFAQGGTPDNTFSGNGKQVSSFSGSSAQANAVAVQRDSNIVAAGQYITGQNQWGLLYSFALIRYLKNGSADPNFGSGGRVHLLVNAPFCNIPSVVIAPDQKILAAGYITVEGNASPFLYLVRLTKNGAIDPDFNHGTPLLVADFMGVQVLLQSDGKIVVGANWFGPGGSYINDTWYAALRFNSDGTPDLSFGNAGQAMTKIGSAAIKGSASCAALAAGNKVLVAGGYNNSHIITIRYNFNGSLDGTFGPGGRSDVTVNNTDPCYASCMTLQADGKILLGGSYTSANGPIDFLAVRLTSNGPLDNTFASNGKKAINFNGSDHAGGIAVNTDGTILLGGVTTPTGQPNKFALCELNTDGSPDLLFGPNNDGKAVAGWSDVNGDGCCIAVGPDRKIVMSGTYYSNTIPGAFAVMRFLPRFKPPPPIFGEASQALSGSASGLSSPSFRIYPNPASTQLQLTGLSPDTPLLISVVDGSGKVLLTQRTRGQDNITLDIARLAPGSYTVVLTGPEGTHSVHFLKLAH